MTVEWPEQSNNKISVNYGGLSGRHILPPPGWLLFRYKSIHASQQKNKLSSIRFPVRLLLPSMWWRDSGYFEMYDVCSKFDWFDESSS